MKTKADDSQPDICPTCGKVIPRKRRADLEPIVEAQYCHCPTNKPALADLKPMPIQEDKPA
jgi:hypothetical protein